MTTILDGICVFAALYDENTCSIEDENLGCRGIVERCPIPELREQEMEELFAELFSGGEEK